MGKKLDEWIGEPAAIKRIHPLIDHEWLAASEEEPQALPTGSIDSHFHLWNRAGDKFLASDLAKQLEPFPEINDGIYIQCKTAYRTDEQDVARQPLGEVDHVVRQAKILENLKPNFRLWMVAGFDLTLGRRIIDLLEEANEISGGIILGIRNQTAVSSDPQLNTSPFAPPAGKLRDPLYIEGVKALGDCSQVLDIWAYQEQLQDVVKIAQECQETRIVINHLGGPVGGIKAGFKNEASREQWFAAIRELAQCDNVSFKISGIGLATLNRFFLNKPQAPTSCEIASVLEPFVEPLLENIGPKRLMFGSNFNVDNGVTSYVNLTNAVYRLTENLSLSEQADIFGGTARTIYQISKEKS